MFIGCPSCPAGGELCQDSPLCCAQGRLLQGKAGGRAIETWDGSPFFYMHVLQEVFVYVSVIGIAYGDRDLLLSCAVFYLASGAREVSMWRPPRSVSRCSLRRPFAPYAACRPYLWTRKWNATHGVLRFGNCTLIAERRASVVVQVLVRNSLKLWQFSLKACIPCRMRQSRFLEARESNHCGTTKA